MSNHNPTIHRRLTCPRCGAHLESILVTVEVDAAMPKFNIGDRVRIRKTDVQRADWSGVVSFSRTDFTGRWHYLIDWDANPPALPVPTDGALRGLVSENWLKHDTRKRPNTGGQDV